MLPKSCFGIVAVVGLLLGSWVQGAVLRSEAILHAGHAVAVPGRIVPLALQFVLPDGWYTYAQDPGDAGMPPSIKLVQPRKGRLKAWQFPPHATFQDAAGTYHGYKHDLVLRSEIAVPESVAGDTFEIVLDVVWMICQDVCLPFRKRVALELPVVRATEAPKPVDGWQDLLESGGWERNQNAQPRKQAKEEQ